LSDAHGAVECAFATFDQIAVVDAPASVGGDGSQPTEASHLRPSCSYKGAKSLPKSYQSVEFHEVIFDFPQLSRGIDAALSGVFVSM